MPHHCCVPLCANNSATTTGILYFAFPDMEKKHNLFLNWIAAVHRDVGKGFSVNSSTRVCDEHFTEEDLYVNGRIQKRTSDRRCTRLLPYAVPSVFKNFPDHMQHRQEKHKPPIDRSSAPPSKRSKKFAVSVTVQSKES